MRRYLLLFSTLLMLAVPASTGAPVQRRDQRGGASAIPEPKQGDFIIRDFEFTSGETLPELRLHYRTLGGPHGDDRGLVRNAVLIMHGTTGSGAQFERPEFAGELFGPGQPLDIRTHYIILPDDIGHGGSSKPSDGLHARFPHYGYNDMIEAEYRLLTEGLGVNHLRLVMGTSMGGMHTWLWGEQHPNLMDALMPLASLPVQISGRNRMWRRILMDAIRNDPDYDGGNYTEQPGGLRIAGEMLYIMGGNPILHFRRAPTVEVADRALDDYADSFVRTLDANDVLYAFASSSDYDPAPDLEKIKAPLIAVNSADDLINPPELGILEKQIKRVPHGRAIIIPLSDETVGHGSHTKAVLWKDYLEELLEESEAKQ